MLWTFKARTSTDFSYKPALTVTLGIMKPPFNVTRIRGNACKIPTCSKP